MSTFWYRIKLNDATLHPPALSSDADDDAEIPWVLLETQAYVADCNNETTAFSYSDSSCDKQVQVTFVAARPPTVSYLCVFCRCNTDKYQEMIPIEPEVVATDGDLVLLRIVVSPEKDIPGGADLYIYRPAGNGGPSLTRLVRPPGDYFFNSDHVGLLSCSTKRPDDPEDQLYMVAALCDEESAPGRGRFVLYLYNSILHIWTTTTVSVQDQQLQYGYFLHWRTKVIAVGGEGNNMGFVDLWQGILLCDLHQGKPSPSLGYIPFPQPEQPLPDAFFLADPSLWRDIAVVKGHIKFVHQQLRWRLLSDFSGQYFADDWVCTMWTRPVAATSLMLDHTWEEVCRMQSDKMDHHHRSMLSDLLPKVKDGVERPLSPFKRLFINRPKLSLDDDDVAIVCFIAKISLHGDNAWVISADMRENRLHRLAKFSEERYFSGGFSCLQSRISKYLTRATGVKGSLKRQGMLPPASSNKRQTRVGWKSLFEDMDADREGTSLVAESGDKMILG